MQEAALSKSKRAEEGMGAMSVTGTGGKKEFISRDDLKQEVVNQLDDYRKFALAGSMINTCVAFVLGAAFGKIIASLVTNIVMPVFNYYAGTDWRTLVWMPLPGLKIEAGVFLGAFIDFFVITVVCYILWKIAKAYAPQPDPVPPPVQPKP